MAGMALASCDDFLTELPTDAIADEEAFSSAKDFTNNLNGVYNNFGRYQFYGRNVVCLGDAASDLVYHDNKSGNFQVLAMWQVESTNGELQEIWEYGYKVINNSAKIIKAGEEADFPESEMATVYGCMAQAYGLKALAAFTLANIFALPYNDANRNTSGIVNVTEPIEAFQQISRATLADNYTLILSDIARAKEYFAREDVEIPGYYYINPAALHALEAKVKLYMRDYAGAIQAAKAALDERGSSLVNTAESYDAMYTSNVVSQEDIFTVVKSATDNPGAGSLSTMYPFYGLHISEEVLTEYAGTDIRAELLNNGDGGKYVGTSEGADAHNIPVLRLPELYLTLAEAYAAQGNYAEAKEYLSVICSARDAGFDPAAVAESESVIADIRQARKLELIQEGHRLFDARRWGIKIDVVKGRYKNFDPSLFAYPIPQTEVNAGFGVVQTEGWEQTLPR
ncbi:MAG: RagB/SusD family nutrient uptake outer membrane protein [Tannerella sp.]|jgi:tetratricopeptide (TPR) repeat protein|nr:RagB/SusD family nutrient uptake outer membrane protein [Tannerella sp.]